MLSQVLETTSSDSVEEFFTNLATSAEDQYADFLTFLLVEAPESVQYFNFFFQLRKPFVNFNLLRALALKPNDTVGKWLFMDILSRCSFDITGNILTNLIESSCSDDFILTAVDFVIDSKENMFRLCLAKRKPADVVMKILEGVEKTMPIDLQMARSYGYSAKLLSAIQDKLDDNMDMLS